MIPFGESILLICEHINKILSEPPSLNKKQIICAILYLLDTSCIRIGNSIYAQENKTYGLTTLRKKHLSINRNEATLNSVWRHFNKTLVSWAMRKYKRFRGHKTKAAKFIKGIADKQLSLVVHWPCRYARCVCLMEAE